MKTNVFDTCDSVLIIGNGFDKNCGLKTGYDDVYKEYLIAPSENKIISEFKQNISDHYENWSDFEKGMADYAKHFDTEDDFITCLRDFNAFMHGYLRGVQKSFSEEWRKVKSHENVRDEFVESINTLGTGVSHNIDNLLALRGVPNISSMGIITFNYTGIFDLLLGLYYPNGHYKEPIHVHGKLGDDPVLGMDRIEQIEASFEISNRVKRNFIKPAFNMEYDSERITKAKNMIRSTKVIFVFGASLGESDLSWRELLTEWLQNNKDNHLFIYDYANSKRTFKTAAEMLDREEYEKHLLLANWRVTTEDVSLDQIHLPCGRNLFNIAEALKKDQEKETSLRQDAEKQKKLREKVAKME